MSALPYTELSRSELSTSGIYSITCTETGKVYVGSAVDLLRRWQHHFWSLSQGKHHNPHLQRSWSKRGPAAFSFSVIELCPTEKLEELEQTSCESIPIRLRFNIRPIAKSSRGMVYGPAARARMSAGQLGRIVRHDTRAKLAAANIGKRASPETKAKMSITRTGRTASDETRAKISAAARSRVYSSEARVKISERAKAWWGRKKIAKGSNLLDAV